MESSRPQKSALVYFCNETAGTTGFAAITQIKKKKILDLKLCNQLNAKSVNKETSWLFYVKVITVVALLCTCDRS